MVTLSYKESDNPDALPQIDDSNADIIIRTSDDVDLEVHSSVLSDASPFFKQVFAEPTPPPRYSGSIDRIPVSENSQTFRRLLRFMYPAMIYPRLSGWEETKSLFEAFLKYEMAGEESFKTVLESLLDTSKQPPDLYSADPSTIGYTSQATSILRVYATIWTHRLKLSHHYIVSKILQGLAVRSLQLPYHEITAASTPGGELDELPASQLTKLFRWIQHVKMSVRTPSFERWDEKDKRFEYPCATLVAHFSKLGTDLAPLVGIDISKIEKGRISKTRLIQWYKGIFLPSFGDRRHGHTIALSPELGWACETCESAEADTQKSCFDAMASHIRKICRREMGAALAASIGPQGEFLLIAATANRVMTICLSQILPPK
ncbi:hypothetical protein PQX77_017459 [Marasmius sp. AFHP31]|nr:hypothetical protein PQX77_017459 [Marasmius sp. AFHP31]